MDLNGDMGTSDGWVLVGVCVCEGVYCLLHTQCL